jgi:hypothetical protein
VLRRAGWVVAAAVLAIGILAGVALLVPAPTVTPRTAEGPTSTPSTPSTPTPTTSSPTPTATAPSPSRTQPSQTATPEPTPTTTGPDAAAPREDLYPITRLKAGQQPPQFVVVSFDGACSNSLSQHYLDLGDRTDARFTFFLSGTCLVPESRRTLYRPPGKPVGSSVVGFASQSNLEQRLRNLSRAWTTGHEVGTHWLGHFCDAQGVGTWTIADWRSEAAQARRFLDDYRAITGVTDVDLPFSWRDLRGDRTPCLLGRRTALHKVLVENGFTYDASDTGSLRWPRKAEDADLWLFPLQTIPVVGAGRSALSMDYNFLVVQNGGRTTADPARCAEIEDAAYRSYLAALDGQLRGRRAPLFLGNHFNTWVCGAYRDALTRFVETGSQRPGVRFVTFDYLVRWLDAQDPAVLRALQRR